MMIRLKIIRLMIIIVGVAWQLKHGVDQKVWLGELNIQLSTVHSLSIIRDTALKSNPTASSAPSSVFLTGSLEPQGSLNAASFSSGNVELTPGLISFAFAFSHPQSNQHGLSWSLSLSLSSSSTPNRNSGYGWATQIGTTVLEFH